MNWTSSIIFLVGFFFFQWGLFQIWEPIGWITLGLFTLRVAYVYDERTTT